MAARPTRGASVRPTGQEELVAREKGPRARSFQRDLSTGILQRRFDVGADDGGSRLDAYLSRQLPWRSRQQIREAITAGAVRIQPAKDEVDRLLARPKPSLRIRTGQVIEVRIEAEPRDLAADPQHESELEVLHDDDHLLAVAKPPHSSLYPTRRHRESSLIERVHRRHAERLAAGLDAGPPPSPCHRLDRETTGVVLFARDVETRGALGVQFEQRTVRKTYLALVRGVPDAAEGEIDLALGPHRDSIVELKQGPRDDRLGKPAFTRWRRARVDPAKSRALIELFPRTGRQHQLRVHLAELGHPILGDKLYLGGDDLFLRSLDDALTEADHQLLELEHQALHAWRLEFTHPATGERITVEAPLPPDLRVQSENGGSGR